MTTEHIMYLEAAQSLFNSIIAGNEHDVSELRGAINDIQVVINENPTSDKKEDPMIYKFENYFPNGPGPGPRNAA